MLRRIDRRSGRFLLALGCLAVLLPTLGPAIAGPADERAAVSALLLAKTQAFSDAGQRGDGASMGKMVGDDLLFYNEGGDQATKQEMASARPGPADANVHVVMTVADWHCIVHGDTAVASFVDVQRKEDHGEVTKARYRSVETWRREGADWRIVGSATIALFDDPPAVTLPTRLLDDYVGTFVDRAGRRFVFTRKEAGIAASLDGGPATVQSAEVADVLFTPGRYRTRKVFERDDVGRVIGFNLRQEGHDLHFRRV